MIGTPYTYRIVLCILIGWCTPQTSNAQWAFSGHYNYLHHKELDKVIQVYNYARPWQSNELTPLTHGEDLFVGYNWKISERRSVHLQPQLGYRAFFTRTQNESQKISAGFHQANLELEIRWNPRALITGVHFAGPLGTRWFMTTTPGYAVNFAVIKKNGKLLLASDDEDFRRPSTRAIYVSLGTGYHLGTLGRFVVTPQINVLWFPQFELHEFSQLVIGTTLPQLHNTYSNALFFQAGIRFTLLPSANNWWDRPNSTDKQ